VVLWWFSFSLLDRHSELQQHGADMASSTLWHIFIIIIIIIIIVMQLISSSLPFFTLQLDEQVLHDA
jgi:hypothetical protein